MLLPVCSGSTPRPNHQSAACGLDPGLMRWRGKMGPHATWDAWTRIVFIGFILNTALLALFLIRKKITVHDFTLISMTIKRQVLIIYKFISIQLAH